MSTCSVEPDDALVARLAEVVAMARQRRARIARLEPVIVLGEAGLLVELVDQGGRRTRAVVHLHDREGGEAALHH